MRTVALVLLCLAVTSVQAAERAVLVRIKPLAWIVEALAPVGTSVQVLVPAGVSPHDYQLRPADAVRVQHSALLVRVGIGMEPWLVQAAQKLPASQQHVLVPSELDAVHHDAGHEEHHEEHHGAHLDAHVWLDPLAVREQASGLAAALIKVFPEQERQIRQRQVQFEREMTALHDELSTRFLPVSQQGFVVYHDAYQRLVQRYHLNQRAAVWRHESIPSGARERAALLKLLRGGDVRCLFYEPEYGREAVSSWLGEAAQSVRLVELDVLGEKLPASTSSYTDFMRDLSGKMAGCLSETIHSHQTDQQTVE
ncbi:MAG: zinc ABC transporter substrate-binding protein [Pseudomonadales bacterium]|nr:zinc ABC transporter substrate-binding protein [Pseudomonadales bacterium]